MMEEKVAALQADACLLPYLQAADDEESRRLATELISGHAEPIIRDITTYKLYGKSGYAGDIVEAQDIQDIHNEVILELLKLLRELKLDPYKKVITNFRSYVAVMTFRTCYKYLRQKYPQRHRLKYKIRYVLSHQRGLSLWESDDGGWLCGFAAWRDQNKTSAPTWRVQQLCGDGLTYEQIGLPHQNGEYDNAAELLSALFNRVGGPIELDDLVDVVAELWGVSDQTSQTEPYEEEPCALYNHLLEWDVKSTTKVEQRAYLQRLWAEIRQLPLHQRVALLLNLRDSKGGDVIALLVDVHIAGVRQIAEALAMPVEELAGLWNDLPLDDATIAKRLGVTRQQVINLRKSARKRLARRMSK